MSTLLLHIIMLNCLSTPRIIVKQLQNKTETTRKHPEKERKTLNKVIEIQYICVCFSSLFISW